jgi:hypothetical protein
MITDLAALVAALGTIGSWVMAIAIVLTALSY